MFEGAYGLLVGALSAAAVERVVYYQNLIILAHNWRIVRRRQGFVSLPFGHYIIPWEGKILGLRISFPKSVRELCGRR